MLKQGVAMCFCYSSIWGQRQEVDKTEACWSGLSTPGCAKKYNETFIFKQKNPLIFISLLWTHEVICQTYMYDSPCTPTGHIV